MNGFPTNGKSISSKFAKDTGVEPGYSKGSLKYSYKRHLKEKIIELLLLLAAVFSVLVTFAIIYMLAKESYVFFQHVSLKEFLTDM